MTQQPSLRWLSIDSIKKQLRIDHCLEDDKLEEIGISVEQALLNLIGRTYEELMETYGHVPAPIRHASLMLCSNLYDHSGPVESGQQVVVPYTFELMVKPYMKL